MDQSPSSVTDQISIYEPQRHLHPTGTMEITKLRSKHVRAGDRAWVKEFHLWNKFPEMKLIQNDTHSRMTHSALIPLFYPHTSQNTYPQQSLLPQKGRRASDSRKSRRDFAIAINFTWKVLRGYCDRQQYKMPRHSDPLTKAMLGLYIFQRRKNRSMRGSSNDLSSILMPILPSQGQYPSCFPFQRALSALKATEPRHAYAVLFPIRQRKTDTTIQNSSQSFHKII